MHRLADGQVKHSSEVFYAGSLWKVSFVVLKFIHPSIGPAKWYTHLQVSVQAFNDEDPHGRRTLGILFTIFSHS